MNNTMYFISVSYNKEWAEKNARQISRLATAFTHKRDGKTLEFSSRDEAEAYCKMFNNSYNQTKHAIVVEV